MSEPPVPQPGPPSPQGGAAGQGQLGPGHPQANPGYAAPQAGPQVPYPQQAYPTGVYPPPVYGQPQGQPYPQAGYPQPGYPPATPQGYHPGYPPSQPMGYGQPFGGMPVPPPAAPVPVSQEPPFFFIGEHDLLIDDKNRLTLPSDIRKELDPDRDGPNLVIFTGANGRYWLYPELYYRQTVSKFRPESLPDQTEMKYQLRLHSRMGRMTPDKQGRSILPEKIVNRRKLGREITLVGNRDHLQLWNRQDWQDYMSIEEDRAEQHAQEMVARGGYR